MNRLAIWFNDLSPRERRLVSIFGMCMGAFLLFLVPLGLNSVLSSRREANAELRRLFDAGKLTFRSHVFDGLDQAIPALNALFEGTNIGKTFLRP